jgi:peptide/nickel transport system permease protein
MIAREFQIKQHSTSLAARLAIGWILTMVIFAIIQPVLSSSKPLVCITGQNEYFYPVFQKGKDLNASCDRKWMPLIPFDAGEIRMKDRLQPPGSKSVETDSFIHHLGTDRLGRDVASGMLLGLRQALIIGIGSMLLVVMVGFLIGSLAAWYGDRRIRFSGAGMVLLSIGWVIIISFSTYAIYLQKSFKLEGGLSIWLWFLPVFIGSGLLLLGRWIDRKKTISAINVSLPLDRILNGIIEFFQALPVMLLLIVLTAIVGRLSIWSLTLIIFFIRWPFVARYVRAEVLAIQERAYLERLEPLHLPWYKTLFREILPNTYHILIALFAFGVSGVIILEATLTFLGLGLPLEQVSWGSLILHGRQHPEAWWLIVFPGLAILITVWSLIIIGEYIQRKAGRKGRALKL